MKQLMLGNQAVARGLFEAGCRFVSSYPGTPSTEISEYASEYDEIYAEWFFTQYAAQFAEKTRVYACEDRFSVKRLVICRNSF